MGSGAQCTGKVPWKAGGRFAVAQLPPNLRRLARSIPLRILKPFLCGKRVLFAGNAPVDADCTVSAVVGAMVRQSFGLEADASLPGRAETRIQNLIPEGVLVAPEALAERSYDVVFVVDSNGDGIGEAALQAVRTAKLVVVVDHHESKASRRSLGLSPETKLVRLRDPSMDAAALLMLGLALRSQARAKASPDREVWKQIAQLVFAATYSDTRGFTENKTQPFTMAILAELLESLAPDVGSCLEGFDTPLDAMVLGQMWAVLERTDHRIGGLKVSIFGAPDAVVDPLSGGAATLGAAPERIRAALLDALERVVGENGADVGENGADVGEDGADVAILVTPETAAFTGSSREGTSEPPDRFSIRIGGGSPFTAAELGKMLGGGGKEKEGGGNTQQTLGDFENAVIDAVSRLAAREPSGRERRGGPPTPSHQTQT